MKIIKLTAIILLLITLPTGIFADEKMPAVIQLDSGPISGKVENGVRIFLGIPYAARLSESFDGNLRKRLLHGHKRETARISAPPAHNQSSQLPANSARTACI
jgi:hypothetical protein